MKHILYFLIYMSKSRFTLLTMKKIALRKSNWLASPEQDFPMLRGCLFQPSDSTLLPLPLGFLSFSAVGG